MEKTLNSGRLYGIGVGPGDPELLTLKAARIIRESPVVVVPKKTRHDRSYAFSVAGDLIDRGRHEIIELVFPMKKNLDELLPYWNEAVEQIAGRLRGGQDCVFLTEGDPLFYGTFMYVLDIMRERYPEFAIEVVPGISSMNAAAAQIALPLVKGDERLAVLPASYGGDGLRRALEDFDVVVLLKVSVVMESVLDLLDELGLTDKAVYVKKCTAADEEIVRNVRQLRGQRLDYLSLMIVRK